jgi:hypothetical protein
MNYSITHELLAIHHAKRAVTCRKLWADLHYETCVRYGKGPLTSGIGNATGAPNDIKEVLRELSREETYQDDESLRHWRASGRKLATWRKYRDSLR